jgi:hypothetical protein
MPQRPSPKDIQKKLYLHWRREVDSYGSLEPNFVKNYRFRFQRSLPTRWRKDSLALLASRMNESRCSLVGDFHTYSQYQKAFLRLLKKVKKPHALGLECINLESRIKVDRYLGGFITLEELREEIEFDRYWPFSWSGYADLLEYAKERKISIVPLNSERFSRKKKELKERDRFVAEQIAGYLQNSKKNRMIVLYGELHLGKPHIPAELRRLGVDPLVVHQNLEQLYFRFSTKREVPELLRNKTEYCLFSSVPWQKQKSFLNWIEGNPREDWAIEADPIGQINFLAKSLAMELGVSSPIYEATTITHLSPRPPSGLSPNERNLWRHSRNFHRTSHLPSTASFLLPELTGNALTESASWEIYRPNCSTREGVLLMFFFGFLGSKILNPRRKANEVSDMRGFLLAAKGNTKKSKLNVGRYHAKRRIFRRALEIVNHWKKSNSTGKALQDPTAEIEALRLAAYTMAQRVYDSFRIGSVTRGDLAVAFTTSSARQDWIAQLMIRAKRWAHKAPKISKSNRI